MQKISINENGEIVDEIGNIIGKKDSSGKMVFNKSPEESSHQSETIKEEIKKSSKIIENSVSYTKYEVTPQSEFTIRFCIGFDDDRAIVYTKDAYMDVPNLEQHWVKFRMWNYKEELDWKNKCMEFEPQTSSFKQNNSKLDEMKVRNLMKSWSFEETDPKFKLLHVNGILADESYDIFKGFFPTIINNIIYLMNQVLENNG